VKNRLKYGANNNGGDFVSKGPGAWLTSTAIQIAGQRTLVLPELKKLAGAGASSLSQQERNLIMVEVWAKHALTMEAGNCSLQAAVAFEYLRKHKKIFPVEVMQFRKKDHGFCILGRPKDTALENFAEWTKDAIVCDPWRDNVGIAGQLAAWFRTTEVDLVCRVDGPEEHHSMGDRGAPTYEYAR
jgi:hypothetical protein